jgi:predicted nucleic acid-binding protein
MGLIFDTSELILAERQRRSIADVIAPFDPHEKMGISVMTIAELQHGFRRAIEPRQAQQRKALIDETLTTFEIYPMSNRVALILGNLDAELAMRGERLDLADLIIAATVIDLGFSLVTHNLRHFERIPGLRIARASTQT